MDSVVGQDILDRRCVLLGGLARTLTRIIHNVRFNPELMLEVSR